VTIVEISDRARIQELLGPDPIANLEPLDESRHGVDGLVTLFAEDVSQPKNLLAVRWGQKHLGLGSIAHLVASRFSGLGELIDAFPTDRGQFELHFPFWTSPAISAGLKTMGGLSMTARYVASKVALGTSPIVRKAVALEDRAIVKPMFPKLVDDAPAYVMPMGDQLVSVAAVTHLLDDAANVHVYTTETARGRGFGRAVLLAIAEELLAMSIRPTVTVDLGDEPAVRMVEGAGFFQHAANLRTTIAGKLDALATMDG
jgi:GNAT superfamily N-acetyltransferase